MSTLADEQRAAIGQLSTEFGAQGIDVWLFGGWAVDFHAGSIAREHADVDVAVWLTDVDRAAEILTALGFSPLVDPQADGYATFQRGRVVLDVAVLAPDGDAVYTPLREGRALWPSGSFGDDVRCLEGVQARVISLPALLAEKSELRSDAAAAAKDSVDRETLLRLLR